MVQAYSKLNELKTVQVKHGSKAFWTTMQTLRFRNKYRENETFNGFFQTNPSTGKQLDLLLAINKVSLMLMVASASITLAKELVRKNVFNPKQNLTNSINLIRDKMPSIQLYGNQIVPFLEKIEKKNLDKALDKLIVRLNYESPDQLIAKLNGFSETQANEWVDEAYRVSGEPLIEDILKNQIFRL